MNVETEMKVFLRKGNSMGFLKAERPPKDFVHWMTCEHNGVKYIAFWNRPFSLNEMKIMVERKFEADTPKMKIFPSAGNKFAVPARDGRTVPEDFVYWLMCDLDGVKYIAFWNRPFSVDYMKKRIQLRKLAA